MFKPVQFAPETEALVRFVEETEPDSIIEETLGRLRAGLDPKALLTAGALAVIRSTELPAHHHGGPIHPVCGTYPVYHTSRMLSGELAYVPIIQHAALCNLHVHQPDMGPAILPETEPLEAKEGGVEATKQAFFTALRTRHPATAEKHLLWFLQHLTKEEVLDIILTKAVARNPEDDHYFLYPTFTARALDCIGWEWAPVLLRPPVRYLSHAPYYSNVLGSSPAFAPIEEILTRYRLLEINLAVHTSSRETDAIGELAERIGKVERYADIPEMLAGAMACGLSLEGAGKALSIGAATIHLRTSYGNPMDVHLHTGINIRRYLLQLPGLGLRNKLLALLTWHTGPEVRLSEKKMEWSPRVEPEMLARLPRRSQEALLDAITESIEAQPPVDWSVVGARLDLMVAAPQVRETIALAQQYADLRYDPMAFFRRMAELACRDDFTEMHVFKFHQAVVEEFCSTREPFRWVHLVSAAKAAAVIHGKRQHVFSRTRELLQV